MRGPWRKTSLVLIDAVLLTVAYGGAFWLRLGGSEALARSDLILQTLPVVLGISLVVHSWQGLYSGILRYTSFSTAASVIKSVAISVLLSCIVIFLLFRLDDFHRSVFAIHGMGAVLLVGGVRALFRCSRRRRQPRADTRRVVLYGAGDTADLVLRGLRGAREMAYLPVALIDDDDAKRGRQIHGVRIHSGPDALDQIARSTPIDEVWICIQGLAGERLRKVYEAASRLDVRVKILPRLDRALLETDIAHFEDPDIADLLRRPSRSLDRATMAKWLSGRRVLITGAGGSIGSELARQVERLRPAALAICDASESNLFHIHGELVRSGGEERVRPFLLDVRDEEAVGRMLRDARPEVIFHAAAYKHVPLVELNPCEGVLNNVQGLRNIACAAREHGVRELVFISTDKAVRPANVMGATKRLGELIVQVLDRVGPTRLCAVRFGNVLGSSGSVVPIFQEQIRRGGPLTVTHPDMTRYFMLVSEAVELVIQAGSVCAGGEVFVLDMGAPVRIADMATDLIRLMGREPQRDVRIEFTGPRPGEKIHEELLIGRDDCRTDFRDIWIDGEPRPETGWDVLSSSLDELFAAARKGSRSETLRLLRRLVPQFAPTFDDTREVLDGATAHGEIPLPQRLPGAAESSPGVAVRPHSLS